MAGRQRVVQSAFSNGVVSPRSLGRLDMDKYPHSAEELQNMIVLPQGSIKRRPGSQHVADALGASRLIPFVFSANQGYILELGNQKVRFFYADNTSGRWTAGHQILLGGAPLTLTTPYDTTAMSLWDIQFTQVGDILYLFHAKYPVQKILRFGSVGAVPGPGDTGWAIQSVTFTVPPTDAFDQDYSGGLTTIHGDANCVVNGALNSVFTLAGGALVFLDGDVDRYIVGVAGGLARITSTTDFDATGVTCQATILVPFPSTSVILAGSWFIRGVPGGWASLGNINAGNWSDSIKFGVGQTEQLYSFQGAPLDLAAVPTKLDCFRALDVGRYINVSGCIAIILSLTAANHIKVQYLSVPEQTFVNTNGKIKVSAAAPGTWSLEDPIWFGQNGYPTVGTIYQNRLYLGGTPFQPKTLWGSHTDDYENFAKGTLADDGLEFTIAGGKLDSIRWLASTPVAGLLAVETDSTEYVVSGGAGGAAGGGGAITPTNIHVQANSAQGGCRLPPILVDAALVYVQRYHTKLFEFSYNIYQASFSSKDLSLYAEHFTHAGIKEMAYQPIPYKIIWMVSFDGRLFGMTYDKTENVLAWHEHRTGYADQGYGAVGTGDSYISVTSIPNPSPELLNSDGTPIYGGNGSATYASDLIWTVVKRLRNGATVYTVELMNEDLLVDCSSITPRIPQVISGSGATLTDPALAGRIAVAYGSPQGAVSTFFPFDPPLGRAALANASGTLTLDYTVNYGSNGGSVVGYGLPFKARVLTVRPEIPQAGSIQGTMQAWQDFFVRTYNSRSLIINGEEVDNTPGWDEYGPSVPADSLEPGSLLRGQKLDQTFVNFEPTLGDEGAPTTRDLRVQALSYDRFGRVLIEQDKPFPLTILGTYGILSFGDV